MIAPPWTHTMKLWSPMSTPIRSTRNQPSDTTWSSSGPAATAAGTRGLDGSVETALSRQFRLEVPPDRMKPWQKEIQEFR